MIKIKAFKAVNDPESCQRYLDGHRKVLEVYGVTKVTSANIEWTQEPYSYVIMVESSDGKVLGGGRIQVSGGSPLPIEGAVGEMDKSIYEIVARYNKIGTGEFCGLWNSREVAGLGIGSIFLGRVGVAITAQLKLGSLFALCSPATLRNCIKVGFGVYTELGKNGTFYYPKEDLLATALLIHNTNTLETADEFERERIFNLREHPQQITMETGPRGELEIEYDLVIR